jgi:hypothetical protein
MLIEKKNGMEESLPPKPYSPPLLISLENQIIETGGGVPVEGSSGQLSVGDS